MVKDSCRVRVADGLIVCELIRVVRVLVQEVRNVLFECVFGGPVEVFTADDLVDGGHRVALVVETPVEERFVSVVFIAELALFVLSGWGKIRFDGLALLTHSSASSPRLVRSA